MAILRLVRFTSTSIGVISSTASTALVMSHLFDGFYLARTGSSFEEVMGHYSFVWLRRRPSSYREDDLQSKGRRLSKYDFVKDNMSIGV